MKTKATLLSYSAILTLIIVSSILAPTVAQTLNANIKYEPKKLDLSLPAPPWIYANITLPGPDNVANIDVSTIVLEGTVPADTTPGSYWLYPPPPKNPRSFNCRFDGQSVVNVVWAKIYHMGITEPNPKKPYRIPMEITGSLYDGTPFAGTGYIAVKIPTNQPPP